MTGGKGVQVFVDNLQALGFKPEQRDRLVVYTIQPVEGALAGRDVATGVDTEELQSWPATPPHWVHLPDTVSLETTNSRRAPLQGWTQHSRKIANWGAREPSKAWIAHVRAVVGEAT